MKTSTLQEMKDKFIGKEGTNDRDDYEYDLRLNNFGKKKLVRHSF